MDEKQWSEFVSNLDSGFDNLETNKERAKRILKDKIVSAIKEDAVDNCGVLFSGGIDSTLISFILKKLDIKFTCYSVGLEHSQDLEWAEKIATALGFKLKTKIFSLDEFEEIVRKVVKILSKADVMKVSVGCVSYAAAELGKNDGVNKLFTGLGSEEIFAGYLRHEEAFAGNNFEALHKECLNGLKGMWERDISRDLAIAKNLDINFKVPLLEPGVVSYAMKVHPMFKMDKDYKKIILREIAEDLGLPKEFSWRKKKAAQYGSKFIKGLDKLAKQRGFSLKKDYLKSLL